MATMSLGRLIAFLSVATTITASLHYYFWARLVRDTALPPPWRPLGTVLIVLLAVLLPTVMVLNRVVPHSVLRFAALPAFVWMGMMLLLLLALLTTDAVRLVAWLLEHARGEGPASPERRLLFQRALGSLAAAVAGGLTVRALQQGLAPVAVKHVEVPLARLPGALDGMTLVQITDVHVGGATQDRGFIERIVQRINQLEPDIIAITGDLVDGSVEALGHAVAPLANLKARHGVFFVTGNHEYYAGVVAWEAELSRLGIRVLRNEHVPIEHASGHGFDLAGVDDWSSRGFAHGHGPDLARALAGRDQSRELVLMAHQPRQIHEAAEHGVGLQLSGHTHGGQIWPWGFMVRLQQGFLAGLEKVGGTWLYTSKGTGYWGPPMRLGADAEITRIVLRSGASRQARG